MSNLQQQILNLLKSGNFTILYHDNGMCCLYPGKIKYDEADDGLNNGVKAMAEFNHTNDIGYTPYIVAMLAKALGGKVDSI